MNHAILFLSTEALQTCYPEVTSLLCLAASLMSLSSARVRQYLSLRKERPMVCGLCNNKNIGELGGRDVAIDILYLNPIKRNRMSVGDHTNSSQVSTPITIHKLTVSNLLTLVILPVSKSVCIVVFTLMRGSG